jgi:phytoene desaturase
MKKVTVLGGGFSSLSASCYLAKEGYDVTLLEKNSHFGGRARLLERDGFKFDMGPTFYWMPDLFESFFSDFGKKVSDFYTLEKLNPAYRVYFSKDDFVEIADNLDDISKEFERVENGSSVKLKKFIGLAKDNYELVMDSLVYKPGLNPLELVNFDTMKKLGLFVSTIAQKVSKTVNDHRLRKILEFPILFLGAKPSNTPAFYNFMNYADFGLGTWYPKGGMVEVANGMVDLAKQLGVKLINNTEVTGFEYNGKNVTKVLTKNGDFESDFVMSGMDYEFTERLLNRDYKQYNEKYWNSKTFAPSALLFYIGFEKKLSNVEHHTLFFDSDFEKHFASIYDDIKWPEEPLFYASFPSITDADMAPEGKEAGIFLIPLAPGLEDGEENRKIILDKIISRLSEVVERDLTKEILFYESYGVDDFVKDYNSFKGNAYGLANTLLQTHYFRPKLKSKKLDNFYFTGQLTVPGPGIPPSIISGKISSELLKKFDN